MIYIKIQEANDLLVGMSFEGHAFSAEYGKDVVCAAISSIAFGTINALAEIIGQVNFQKKDNKIDIIISEPSEKADLILRTAYIQCETVRQKNQKFVKIKKEKIK